MQVRKAQVVFIFYDKNCSTPKISDDYTHPLPARTGNSLVTPMGNSIETPATRVSCVPLYLRYIPLIKYIHLAGQ